MNDVETIWQELLTAALLGTERHPLARLPVSAALGGLFNQLDPADPPHQLLQSAALTALYARVGRLPARLPPGELPTPCEAETLPRCRPAGGRRLGRMLGGTFIELLPEWLALAGAAGQRAPEELLPDLLTWGEAHSDRLDLLLPVLGARGGWLARQAPFAESVRALVLAESLSAEERQQAWQTGRKTARRLLLRRLRQTHPAQALELLALTWAEDNADERQAFLETLEIGLSPADEPFLEAALDDRSKEVRRTAAELLAHLPQSGLVQRQLQRAQACLTWKPGVFLRKPQLEVTLPTVCSPAMQRDGVSLKTSSQRLGEKAGWLAEMLAAVPPAAWSRLWAKTPAELLEVAAAGEWHDLLIESWTRAAARHPDADWIEALLRRDTNHPELLAGLPPSRRAALLEALLQDQPKEAMDLALGYAAPWDSAFTRVVLRHLYAYYEKFGAANWMISIQAAVRTCGFWMDPAVALSAAEQLLPKVEQDPNWTAAMHQLLQALDFRHQMREELR